MGLTVEEKKYFTPVLTCPDLFGPTRNTVTMYARLAMSFFALSNALTLQSYVLSWGIAYFNRPNGELSNGARVMELY